MRPPPLLLLPLCLSACASSGPTSDAPTGEPSEKVTEGNSTITVLGGTANPTASASGPPPTDGYCRAMAACAERGACTAKDGTCVAASWRDCENVPACIAGRCRFAAGSCTAVADCRDAHVCAAEGRCASGTDGACIANDAKLCGSSAACQSDGLCNLGQGRCVATGRDCAKATACAAEGHCSMVEGACLAATERDCENAAACKSGGRCSARDGGCVKSCAESDSCRQAGRCSERKIEKGQRASCIAASDDECKKSQLCTDAGLCSLGLDGDCVAGDDVECRRAVACKEQGRCTFQKGRCVPASNAECAQASIACKVDGRCRFQDGRCVK